ncbi:LysR substrate-binding domain-containing protein [Nisaea sp.]|uniref:LysR substrate-binding domain-containing protein n=1 Tax=Nisaea sp. TaxID=2024842 RepID=UPI0032646864
MSLSPPRPKGPPLNALRAFEAAARNGSFATAAEELSVTPGAIAQHVKSLEAWAGSPLFERRSQGVRLSPLGSDVLEDFSEAFDRLGEALQKLRTRSAPTKLHIAALASVAQLWLTPRLPALRARFPGIAFSITALERRPNPKREPFDLSLFFEEERDATAAGMIVLDQDRLIPVCAPALAAGLKTPADLSGSTFLHDATWSSDWETWLAVAMPGHRIKTVGPAYSLYSLAVSEAIAGAGILIGHESLIQDALDKGSLVPPFPSKVGTGRVLALAAAQSGVASPLIPPLIKALKGLVPFRKLQRD